MPLCSLMLERKHPEKRRTPPVVEQRREGLAKYRRLNRQALTSEALAAVSSGSASSPSFLLSS